MRNRSCERRASATALRSSLVRWRELIDQLRHADPALNRRIVLEGQLGSPLQPELAGEASLQDAVCRGQAGKRLLALALRPEDAHEDGCVAEVRRCLDPRDGDKTDPWILEVADAFRDHLPDGLVHPSHPVAHTGIQATVSRLRVMLALAASAVALTAGSASKAPRFQVLGHADPKGGYSGDVVGERHYAYLSSRRGVSGDDCPAQGVRVYDLANPRRPRHIATFADGGSTPEFADAWTEKTIVRRVRTAGFDGVLAVTSLHACGNGFRGFSGYDVTNPATPRRLALVRTEPRGSHEIWLATARGHAWAYTALPSAEFAVEPDQFGFHILDVTQPRTPVEVGGWSACRDLHRR